MAPESQLLNDSIWRVLSNLLSPLASFAAFVLMYRFLPYTGVRLRDVWLGALIASMAFEAVKWSFVKYIITSLDYNVVYGSVGAIVALLTWVYVSAIIVLFGALITSRYAAYASSIEEKESYSFRLLWTGFRVSVSGLWNLRGWPKACGSRCIKLLPLPLLIVLAVACGTSQPAPTPEPTATSAPLAPAPAAPAPSAQNVNGPNSAAALSTLPSIADVVEDVKPWVASISVESITRGLFAFQQESGDGLAS